MRLRQGIEGQAALVDDLAREVAALPPVPGIAFRWSVAPDLPPLLTDALKLRMILKNLIDWTSRLRPQPFNGKQCLLMSASPSMAARESTSRVVAILSTNRTSVAPSKNVGKTLSSSGVRAATARCARAPPAPR